MSPPSAVKSESMHDATSRGGVQPRTRHSKYFFDDVPVIFEVEGGILFKVHKHFLERGSSVFKTMFSCPPDSAGPEGATEDKPIVLPGVKADEFAALLDYFYEPARNLNDAIPSSWSDTTRPRKKGKSTKGGPSTTERLASLLSIATRFEFERPRQFAIETLGRRLSEFTPVRRILLARQFEVNQWLKPAYIDLCKRDEPMSVLEAEEVGLETTVLMAKAREAFVEEKTDSQYRPRCISPPPPEVYALWPEPSPPTPSPQDPLQVEVERIITNIFFPQPPPRVCTPESD